MSLPIPSEPVSNADFREFYNKVARLYHYPECWDTMAYPTLYDGIYECRGQCTTCGNYLPAEEPKDNSLPPCCDCVRAEGDCGFERLTCKAKEPLMEVEP